MSHIEDSYRVVTESDGFTSQPNWNCHCTYAMLLSTATERMNGSLRASASQKGDAQPGTAFIQLCLLGYCSQCCLAASDDHDGCARKNIKWGFTESVCIGRLFNFLDLAVSPAATSPQLRFDHSTHTVKQSKSRYLFTLSVTVLPYSDQGVS